jgi:hypothetical protein
MYLNLKIIQMKKVKFLLVTVLLFPAFCLLQAQTVQEIISKTVQAIGGKDSLEKINTISIESSMQVMGNDLATTTTIVNGKGYKSVSDMNGQSIIQCYTEKGGWSINPMSGGSVEAMPANQYKSGKMQYDIGGPFLNFESKGNKFELLGKEMVGQTESYKLKLVTKDSTEFTYFIDTATFHVIQTTQKTDMMGQEIIMRSSMSDFRKLQFGYVMPFALDLSFGDQFSLNLTIKKVEFNKTIDPAIFEMPK